MDPVVPVLVVQAGLSIAAAWGQVSLHRQQADPLAVVGAGAVAYWWRPVPVPGEYVPVKCADLPSLRPAPWTWEVFLTGPVHTPPLSLPVVHPIDPPPPAPHLCIVTLRMLQFLAANPGLALTYQLPVNHDQIDNRGVWAWVSPREECLSRCPSGLLCYGPEWQRLRTIVAPSWSMQPVSEWWHSSPSRVLVVIPAGAPVGWTVWAPGTKPATGGVAAFDWCDQDASGAVNALDLLYWLNHPHDVDGDGALTVLDWLAVAACGG